MTDSRRTYKHALSPREAIEHIFEYEPQESSLSEVLQLTVEQVERAYQTALADRNRQAEIADLKKELELAEQERDLAREMYIELETAGDNLMAGGTHEHLVLSKRDHHGLQPCFTKESLYYWAKECHGQVIPEWGPSAQQMPELPPGVEYVPSTSAMGSLETVFIIAGALGRLVDKLAEDGHIKHPTGDPFIKDDDTVDLTAIGAYLATCQLPPGTVGKDAGTLEDRQIGAIAEVDLLVLALVAHVFCQLAEQARVNKWVTFRDIHEEEIKTPFYKKEKYSSSHIYNYLVKVKALKADTANQRKSSIHHRLGDAQKLVIEKGLTKFSAVQLRDLLDIGQQRVRQRKAAEEAAKKAREDAAKKGKRTLSPNGA